METIVKPLFISCRTPMHVGSGSDLGIVDLPIQREQHTGFPKIESSSLKGAKREAFVKLKGTSATSTDEIDYIFGPGKVEEHPYASAMGVSNARLFLFPVKSAKGIFAWITCPMVLNEFQRNMELCGFEGFNISHNKPDSGSCILQHPASNLEFKGKQATIMLEEYLYEIAGRSITVDWKGRSTEEEDTAETGKDKSLSLGDFLAHNLKALVSYGKEKLNKDIVLLNDDDFLDFVELSTEVNTRIKIESDTGTVSSSGPFNVEYLPEQSILYALVFADRIYKTGDVKINEYSRKPENGKMEKEIAGNMEVKEEAEVVMDYLKDGLARMSYLQIGGNATLGKGICSTLLLEHFTEKEETVAESIAN